MARIRSVHPGFFKDEDFVELSDGAALLFIGLWTHADDQGVFPWKPKTIKMELRPASNSPVEPLLEEMLRHNCIRKFAMPDGRIYGAIRNFRKHQRPKTPNAIHPLPPEIAAYVSMGGERQPPNVVPISEIAGADGGAISETEPDNEARIPQSGEIAPQMEDVGGKREDEGIPPTPLAGGEWFLEFWKAYPHRGGLTDPEDRAAMEFARLVSEGADPSKIITGAKRYATATAEAQMKPQYVLSAHKWLASKGWRTAIQDQPKTPAKRAETLMNLDPERREWVMAVRAFRSRGYWAPGAGGKPGTPQYRGPQDLLTDAERIAMAAKGVAA